MFTIKTNFEPCGDQPQAIKKLIAGIQDNAQRLTLLGVTGSGKTFTMANVIQELNRPTLIISPNKSLAAQLYQEFKALFPNDAVHYFVSYYDYYQPEAFMPETNVYIEKDARINETIDRMRHATIQDVLSKKNVIVISSVSCIYGLGDPTEYQRARLQLKVGQTISPTDMSRHLNFLQYERTNEKPTTGKFILKAGKATIQLVTNEMIELFFTKGNRIQKIVKDGMIFVDSVEIYPAHFWITPQHKMALAIRNIKTELDDRVEELQQAGKFEAAERLEKRTLFDIGMMKKRGYTNGIENYSRHLGFRQPGEPPLTLIDYFKLNPSVTSGDVQPLLFIDESHITVSQVKAMSRGDYQRKENLVQHGFRLPSAFDNRPLTFEEFESKIGQTVFVSATPSEYELEKSQLVAHQIVRPTGILDPVIIRRPVKTQVEDLMQEIKKRAARNERVLALTLTKRSAENLTEFLLENGIKAVYLHSEIKTLKRPEIIESLRSGEFDVLVGINLLREGLDLPEVSLVAILDADKEGFLRSTRGLIQMAGRAARSLNGEVIIYADTKTGSIKQFIKETTQRRIIQDKFNRKNNAVPVGIYKAISNVRITEAVKEA